jgi:hypothetical protein
MIHHLLKLKKTNLSDRNVYAADPIIRSFSSFINFINRFKTLNNKIMVSFIKNEKNQQEIVLSLHFFLLIVCIAILFPYKYYLLFLALCILLVLGGIILLMPQFFSIYSNVSTIIKQNFNLNLSLLFGGFFLIGLVYFGYYLNVFFLTLLFGLSTMKENYLIKTKEKPTKLTLYLNDFRIIENHLKIEFPRFQFIRLHNLLLFFFLILGLRFNLSGGIWLINTEFMTILQILFVVLVFNFMLVTIIQIIIIFYCNMPVTYKLLATCGKCVAVGGVTLCSAQFMHHGTTTPFIDPFLPFGLISAYQIKVMGFAARTGDEIAVGKAYKFFLNENPPVDDDGVIKIIETREKLKEAGYTTVLENIVRARNDAITAMIEPFRWTDSKK